MELKIIPVDKEFASEGCDDSCVEFDLNDIFSLYPAARQDVNCTPKFDKSATNKELTFSTPHKTLTTSGLKSPFSLSSLGESPWSSPQSSTPISGDVSISKSFETPSFHSPIILPGDSRSSVGYGTRSVKLTSDTVLTWETNMETPAQHLSTSSAQKLSSSVGEFSTPPRPQNKSSQKATKKLFVSPDKTRSETKLSISSKQSNDGDESNSMNLIDGAEKCDQADEKSENIHLERSESEDSKDFSLFSNLEDSAKENCSTVTRQTSNSVIPNQTHQIKDQPAPQQTEVVEQKADACDNMVFSSQNCELETSNSFQTVSIKEYDDQVISDNSFQPKISASVMNDTSCEDFELSEEKSPASIHKRNFQYPTDTQNHTQFQLDNQRDSDSLGFSQWPNEIYEHANKIVSNLDDGKCAPDEENGVNNHSVTEEKVKNDLLDCNQDSLAFSQWPRYVYENLNKAIADLENKENVHAVNFNDNKKKSKEVDAGPLPKEITNVAKREASSDAKSFQRIESASKATPDNEVGNKVILQNESSLQGFATAFNQTKTISAAAEGSFAHPKNFQGRDSVKKSTNIFNEDFSDLDMSKIPSFTKASHSVSKPKGKDPTSFFGEDFSDLDQANFSDTGFEFASKVFNASFMTADKAKPSTHNSEDKSSIKFAGFSTASGKNVEFSAKSLNFIRSSQATQVKEIPEKHVSFVDIHDATTKDGSGIESNDLKTDKLSNIDMSTPNPSETSPSSHLPVKPGFSTASGVPVKVSDSSLDHVRSSQVPTPSCLAGFATASGAPVHVAEESLNAVRCSQVPCQGSLSIGFSTAGGAPVKVQEEALEFIRSSQVPKPSGVMTGFSTASGKGVSVCQESFDLIRSSQATPFSCSQVKAPPTSSVPHSSKSRLKLKTSEQTPITPIFKAGSRSGLSLAQSSKRARVADQSRRENTPLEKVRKQSSGSEESVISRVRRESSDDNSTPAQYLNKRRRLSKRSSFNSPVTEKTRSCAVVSSPLSHRIRPGITPLLSSPKLESTIEETPTDTTSFITPYNKACPTAQPAPKKEVPTSMLWKQTSTSLPTSNKLVKPGALHSARQPVSSLPPPRHYEPEELFELGVSCGVEEITAQNAQDFRFTKPDYFLENDGEEVALSGCGVVLRLREGKSAGHSEFHQALLRAPKIKKQFISVEWVENHYRLIVWKCAGLERTQPGVYAGCALTPENVMSQLLLRYSVEVEEGRRSALRRITEKDDTPAKPMTLVVSGIGSKTIEVSDGWYCLECVLDNPLSVLIQSRAIKVGSKIVSFTSSIIGTHTDGIPPLQAKATLKLKLNYNCVRPAVWHATLGYTDVNTMPSLPISVLAADGGMCACIEVVLIRRYPVQFLETLASGKKVFRSEKEERRRQEEYGRARDAMIEDITHKLSKRSQVKGGKSISKEAVKGIDSGQELYELIKDHPDPTSLQTLLTSSQREMLAEYTEKERCRQEVQHKKELLEELNDKCPPRQVISLVKHKIHCALEPNSRPYFLTTWRAEHQAPLKEGRCYKIYNISCSAYRGSGLSLSSSKSSMFREMKGDYSHLSVKPICTVSSVPASTSECDLIGKVLQTDRQTDARTVLVVGDTEDVGEVVVYSASEEFKVGCVICIVNLQVSKTGSLICNEKSSWSSSPKDKKLSAKLNEFRHLISDKPESYWEALLSTHSTEHTIEPDNWDDFPDIPLEQFDGNTNKQTDTRTKSESGAGVPLFSVVSGGQGGSMVAGLETEELLGCSDRARSDFQTPVKTTYPDYNTIFK